MSKRIKLENLDYSNKREESLKIIGLGQFSILYLVQDKLNGKKYVLKKVR